MNNVHRSPPSFTSRAFFDQSTPRSPLSSPTFLKPSTFLHFPNHPNSFTLPISPPPPPHFPHHPHLPHHPHPSPPSEPTNCFLRLISSCFLLHFLLFLPNFLPIIFPIFLSSNLFFLFQLFCFPISHCTDIP